MNYYGGCDVGSTYTKAVILDETGRIAASTIQRSRMNAAQSSEKAMADCVSQIPGLKSAGDLRYIISDTVPQDPALRDALGSRLITRPDQLPG